MLSGKKTIETISPLKEHFRYIFPPPLIFAIIFFLSYFSHTFTEADSAQYLLSSLVQSEAAILAIVVSLSLIAVQLAASSYSRGVIDNFKDSYALKVVIGLYIISIICSLSVLKLIRSPDSLYIVFGIVGTDTTSNLESYICLCLSLGILSFITLIPYTYYMFEKLKPSKIVEEFSSKITKSNLISGDPIQPIMELVQMSITKNDYKTIEESLKKIEERICTIFEEELLEESEENKISETVYKHFSAISRFAIDEGDENSALAIISNIGIIGKAAVEKGLKKVSAKIVASLGEIGRAATEKEFEEASWGAVFCLEELEETAVERKATETIWEIISSLREIAINVVGGKPE